MFLPWGANLSLADYPFVVIGSGPAGCHLALQLAKRGRVLIVEAGNTAEILNSDDDMYRLVSIGRDYPDTGSRLLAFGGTSNHWGGHSRPFSRQTFAARPGIPEAWPITYEEYAPYLEDAGKFLNLLPFDPPSTPLSIESGIFAGHEHLTATQFRYGDPAVRLGEPGFVAQIGVHPDIDVLTYTRLLDIDLSSDGARVETVTLMHRPSRETVKLAVRQLLLCTGGIENARVLLWAGRKYSQGNPLRGGPNELTGKHFTEKPYLWPVDIFIDSRVDFTGAAVQPDHQADLCWGLTEAFRLQHGLPRFGAFPGYAAEVPPEAPFIEWASNVYAHVAPSYVHIDPAFQFEQTPHDQSYVQLSNEVDADGVARAELHWEISAADLAAYRKATLLFCSILSQKGFALARLKEDYRSEDWSDVYIAGCNHHIGTTRMASSAADGVVDRDCRVFGLENLYVAGSSIFPSGDYVNPTLNLVALAGRLADHVLKSYSGST